MGELHSEEEWKKKFPAFPFKPYSIQIDFMNALYQSLDRGGIAMLESPTGTGKTLSIICSSLQWLVDQKQKQYTEKAAVCVDHRHSGSDDEPDWLRNFEINKDDKEDEHKKINYNNNNNKKKNKTTAIGPRRDLLNSSEKDDDILKEKEGNAEGLNDNEFLVVEYESDDELESGSGQSKRKSGEVSFSSSSDEEESKENGFDYGEEEEEARLKIYFCSRTHSQLSQFVKELRRTVFPVEVRVVCLSSRKNSCINEEVLKLGNPSRINDRCLELQKHKKDNISKKKITNGGGRTRRTKASSCGGCPMLKKHKVQKQFRNEIYEEGVLDIEDLVHLGKRLGTCPYYGSRSMIPAADLVILPYQSLLSRASRESLGLKLKNNIVIIDEAHNLADSLISMYDSRITLSQLDHVHSLLESYFGRFRNVLGPGNRRYIQTLMVITRAFTRILHIENPTNATETSDSSMAINEFLFSLNIDNINLIKLLRYIKESNIIHKASGYGDRTSSLNKESAPSNAENSIEEGSSVSSFQALANILMALNNRDGDGRIIISKTNQGGEYLKYVMLSGEKIFSEVTNEVRAVILAGGTLQPIEETRERLFPSLKPDQLHFFSCNHIVSPDRILPLVVSNGPTGQSFDFSFGSRSSPTMIEELGLLICNLVTVIPEGIVVFFSSFDYETQVHDAWKSNGIISRISKRKRLFREPRGNKDVDVILNEYKNAIINEHGSILLAVVGGKVSEGINFSDGMGRCIIMVGLPYPSPSDIELIERIKHIDGLVRDDLKTGMNVLRCCGRRGKEYYENLCMKAVNQSIGRAIRHINDYAAILLVDSRYAAPGSSRSTNKLPHWIRNRLSATDKYGEVHRLLHQFFKLNKSQAKQ
ncbi:ATP-dependent DNA helicase DDX11 [Impatiens glandulifera]|uniref:ATP-dependent DNA helicase DDX11 n=1 Tax=Impatiens glandulifera TaxID=253017 RepID=UPI001FB14A2F|nr:ATP-dependent DNA helicase DDX11 [Impatiens glandulifera]